MSLTLEDIARLRSRIVDVAPSGLMELYQEAIPLLDLAEEALRGQGGPVGTLSNNTAMDTCTACLGTGVIWRMP